MEIDEATKLVQTEIAKSALESWMVLHIYRANLFNLASTSATSDTKAGNSSSTMPTGPSN